MSITTTQKKRKASTLQDENIIHQVVCNADALVSPVLIQSEESQQNVNSSSEEEETWAAIKDKRVSFHNKVKLRYIKRVGLMQRHKVWYTRAEYVEIRDRESKRKRDRVLESHGIQFDAILPTTYHSRQEVAILNGDRSIRVFERNLKAHKSNHARHETQIRLLQQKVEKEAKVISKNRAGLADAQASIQAVIEALQPNLPSSATTLQQEVVDEEGMGTFKDAKVDSDEDRFSNFHPNVCFGPAPH